MRPHAPKTLVPAAAVLGRHVIRGPCRPLSIRRSHQLSTSPGQQRAYGQPHPHQHYQQQTRYASTHYQQIAQRNGGPSIVKPKPSDPRSAAGELARDSTSGSSLGASDSGARSAALSEGIAGGLLGSGGHASSSTLPPLRTSGPPRLIRYERLEDGSIAAWHESGTTVGGPLYASGSPASFGLQARIHAATSRASRSPTTRQSPTGLFSLYPAAAAAASTSTTADISASTPAASIRLPVDEMVADGLRQRDGKGAGQAEEANAKAQKHDHGHHHHHHHHHGGSAEEADQLLAALKGKGDRGSTITVVGLASNVGLCAAKGVAGVALNSASLLADAAHSLSDMFADLVTLFCWKMSQKPPSASHPLGYGKYETMGSLGVSIVLVAGAVGIGFHSYGLLLEALQPTLQNAPAAIQALGHFTGSIASAGADHGHSHAAVDAHGPLDPNAMWFALLSIVVKEWLYWATLKIAREENSSVLEANALHHRSDSLSSGVTFLAIGGSWLGFPVLDPLGGLLVAGLIGKQGADLLFSALGELSDRGVEPEVLESFEAVLLQVQQRSEGLLLGWSRLRAVKSGVSTFVDVTLEMPPDTRLSQAKRVEDDVRKSITGALKGVKEVRVHLDAVLSS